MSLLVLPFPAIDPVAIAVGPLAIRWYALAYVAGIFLGWWYSKRLAANAALWGPPGAPMTVRDIDDFVVWAAVGIVGGGRLGYILFYDLPEYVAHPAEILAVWNGGMSFHGGFLGTVLALVLFAWRRRIPIWSLVDVVAAGVPFGLGLGRIANFVNGELWGRATDMPWAMLFPNAPDGGTVPRHPSQLYEAAMEGIALFLFLRLLTHRYHRLATPGFVSGGFAFGYGLARTFSEIFREPDIQIGFLPGGLTEGMVLSIPMMIAGAAVMIWGGTPAGRRRNPRMTPLGEKLIQRIRATGPMTVADYMAACLSDPEHGYYMRGDPFGRVGDFVTAPEVSQMFGELIGLYAVAAWERMGEPKPVMLVELGPGRGTLMADMLRAASVKPAFLAAADVHLVEIGPRLREIQRATLAASRAAIHWHARLADVPDGPTLVIANEFFDALPIRQFEWRDSQWAERMIGLAADGMLAVGLRPVEQRAAEVPLPDGAIVEAASIRDATAAEIGARLARFGGAALIIDYGSERAGYGDTLQAVKGHRYDHPLASPGEADLTAHVDFAALARAATAAGAAARPVMRQGEFLLRLGLIQRAEVLARGKDPKTRDAVAAAMDRLAGKKAMGDLFKVLALASPGLKLAAFDA